MLLTSRTSSSCSTFARVSLRHEYKMVFLTVGLLGFALLLDG